MNESMTTHFQNEFTTAETVREQCKCCGGSGVQQGFDGIKIRCPACGGSGDWNPNLITWSVS
jgi:DnaJ-class molecular chaperone